MQRRNIFTLMVATGVLLLVATGFWLATATPASAQCGSQASSCKNCHEVQGQDPVNKDGTAWHTSHAFGDFCYICHAGNSQAKDQTEAHTGMVPPLSDIQASCMQCHPNDLETRAQVYATALGVEIGAGVEAGDGGQAVEPVEPVNAVEPVVIAPVLAPVEIDLSDPNLVDYVQRYEEIVLGKKPVNWGNMILIGLIGLVVVGGGGFVIKNEGWLDFSSLDTKPVDGGYPADVVEFLPAIKSLKPKSRKALRKVLDNPALLEKVLGFMETVAGSDRNEEKP